MWYTQVDSAFYPPWDSKWAPAKGRWCSVAGESMLAWCNLQVKLCERIRGSYDDALYNSMYTLLYCFCLVHHQLELLAEHLRKKKLFTTCLVLWTDTEYTWCHTLCMQMLWWYDEYTKVLHLLWQWSITRSPSATAWVTTTANASLAYVVTTEFWIHLGYNGLQLPSWQIIT